MYKIFIYTGYHSKELLSTSYWKLHKPLLCERDKDLPPKHLQCAPADLASVVVDDEALVPAVEVFVGVDLDAELLQHGLVGSFAHRVHGGAHVVQDAHDAWGILGKKQIKNTSTSYGESWLWHSPRTYQLTHTCYDLMFIFDQFAAMSPKNESEKWKRNPRF